MLNKLAKVFSRQLDQDTIDVYWDTLKSFAISEVSRTCQHLAATSTYFPTPVAFRDFLRELPRGARKIEGGFIPADFLEWCTDVLFYADHLSAELANNGVETYLPKRIQLRRMRDVVCGCECYDNRALYAGVSSGECFRRMYDILRSRGVSSDVIDEVLAEIQKANDDLKTVRA